jgi:hypothetical protein
VGGVVGVGTGTNRSEVVGAGRGSVCPLVSVTSGISPGAVGSALVRAPGTDRGAPSDGAVPPVEAGGGTEEGAGVNLLRSIG